MEARPEGGVSVSVNVKIGADGSGEPSVQARPCTAHSLSLDFLTVSARCVHLPVCQSNGAEAFTASALYNSNIFLPGLTCNLYPPTPPSPTLKVGARRPLLVP